ncbi:TPA: EexN family lipoprotein [Yersinia enterocolitica]|nr:EexN family lipoprotein [Yersinia enterocolitica]
MNAAFRTTHVLALVGLLSACGPSPTNDTVEFLTAHPERIREVQRLCREERTKVTDDLCVRAAEAAKRRFFGERPEQHPKSTSN